MLAAAVLLLSGCTLRLPPGLRAPAIPAEPVATFQAAMLGRVQPPLTSPASPWQLGAEPPASVEAAGDALRIASGPGSPAWASPLLPFTPLNAPRSSQVEELTWDSAVTLTQRFFIVCALRFAAEPGAILFQATPFDLQISQDATRPEGGRSESVSRLVGDGAVHFWRLRLDDSGLQLRLDGSVVWQLPGRRQLAHVAFGETRSDAQHGGTMLLRNVVYFRRPA
jgi:hypothetical protein